MIVELVRGGLADVGVIFGHWEDDGRTFGAFHKDFRMYEKYVTNKEKVKARALREVLAKDLNRSLMLNSNTYRERHNAKCDSNPELKPIQAIEELDILTDDIWNGLDKVFTSTYEDDLAHNMGGGEEVARDLMDTYRLRVRGFLDEYVEQELDGIAPEAMDERQRTTLEGSSAGGRLSLTHPSTKTSVPDEHDGEDATADPRTLQPWCDGGTSFFSTILRTSWNK
jgi:hypothetical protein